jgi:hypothetical protein
MEAQRAKFTTCVSRQLTPFKIRFMYAVLLAASFIAINTFFLSFDAF